MALQRIRTLFMALQRIRTLFMALQRIRTLFIWLCRGSEHCCFPTVLCCSDANGDRTFVTTELFVMTKYFCCDKYLSRQTHVCCDKSFVTTSILLLQQKMCSQQKFCRDKIMFAATNVCCKKGFVATKICLLQQKFCRDKHTFVVTKLLSCLSRQKLYLLQLAPMIVRL